MSPSDAEGQSPLDEPGPSATPEDLSYADFYGHVTAAQLAAWAPQRPGLVLDLSGRLRWAQQLRDDGHDVVRVGREALAGVRTVVADPRSLGWLTDSCVDAVLAESVLSSCLAAEESVRDLARVLRPGGRLLASVDSLLTGLARLADQGRWAELADVPAADVVLVPDAAGVIGRCFWPQELHDLLTSGGFVVDWVRPRSVLTRLAVERALAEGGAGAMPTLVRTELALARGREGESTGMHLVASARRPA